MSHKIFEVNYTATYENFMANSPDSYREKENNKN